MEDRLAKLQTDLGLDQTQVDSMRGIFQNQTVKVDEMRQSMREARDSGLDMGSMREMWTGLRDDTNTAVQGILSPSQYEQYEESNSNRGWGGRGRGGGARLRRARFRRVERRRRRRHLLLRGSLDALRLRDGVRHLGRRHALR